MAKLVNTESENFLYSVISKDPETWQRTDKRTYEVRQIEIETTRISNNEDVTTNHKKIIAAFE